MAAWRRRPPEGQAICHSDHGSQYTSWAFGRRLRAAGVLGSMAPSATPTTAIFWGPAPVGLTSRHLKQLTKTAAPELVAAFGIGPDIAAEMLVTAGDNPDRIRSDAALAKLCGACPIPASSGKTNGRHRLNRGGNRQANAALYRAIIVRMRWHPPTIASIERRTAEGLSKREIIRCLKRYLAREVYGLLPPPSSSRNLASAA